MAKAASRAEIESVIAEDPYLQMNRTTYEIIEFHPTRASVELASVLP